MIASFLRQPTRISTISRLGSLELAKFGPLTLQTIHSDSHSFSSLWLFIPSIFNIVSINSPYVRQSAISLLHATECQAHNCFRYETCSLISTHKHVRRKRIVGVPLEVQLQIESERSKWRKKTVSYAASFITSVENILIVCHPSVYFA